MKKIKILIAGVCTIMGANDALASESRHSALGNISTIPDQIDVFQYPGIAAHDSFALLELGSQNHVGSYGGAVYAKGSMGYGGFFKRALSTQSGLSSGGSYHMNAYSAVRSYLGSSINDNAMGYTTLENPVDLFWGMKLDKKSGLGFRLSFADTIEKRNQKENKTENTSRSAQMIDLNIGYSKLESSRIDVSLGVGLSRMYKHDAGGSPKDERSYEERMTLKPSFRNIVKTPTGSFGYSLEGIVANPKAKATANNQSKSINLKEMGLSAAYALHYNLPENFGQLSGQARYSYLNSKAPQFAAGVDSFLASDESIVMTANVLDATLAAEINATSYLGLMLSINPVIWGRLIEKNNIDPDEPTVTSTLSASDQSFYSFGLYSQITPAFRIDARYSSAIFYNGPNFVTGNTSSPFISQISLSYIL